MPQPQHSPLRRIIANLPRYSRNWLQWLAVLGEAPPSAMRPPDRQPARAVQPKRPPAPAAEHFVAGSWFLHRCYHHLMRVANEDLHLVTGMTLDNQYVMTDMVTLQEINGSATGAFVSAQNVREGLMLMERYGYTCLGVFHSHPGRGAASTQPSGTDWSNQKTWEQAYPLVGAVFSRDGYVRFFASKPQVQLAVVGKKVTKINENLYRLEID